MDKNKSRAREYKSNKPRKWEWTGRTLRRKVIMPNSTGFQLTKNLEERHKQGEKL